jgi:hypothetical protein
MGVSSANTRSWHSAKSFQASLRTEPQANPGKINRRGKGALAGARNNKKETLCAHTLD